MESRLKSPQQTQTTDSDKINSHAGAMPLNLPGYQFVRELGHGAQGQVLLADRLSDHTKVAIKKLNIDNVKNWKEYELFHREADVLASLDINGVAHFYEAVERLEDNPPCSYIVQEYINGKSLNDMLKSGHRFTLDMVYGLMMQLITILYELHTHEPPIIHRDIKPSNILIKAEDGRYQAYLIDFGAVSNPQVQGGGSTVAGTFGYMPPEQLMGKPVPASDIYSLAAVAVYLITGRSPADMQVKDFHLIFEPDMQNMPPSVVNTLRSMLEPAPEKRLCDYQRLYNLFEAFQNDIYDYSGSRQKALSPSALSQKLNAVEYYGQNGNFELWQELSDELPRDTDDLPSCYKQISRLIQKTPISQAVFKNSSMPKQDIGDSLLFYRTLIFSFITIVSILIAIFLNINIFVVFFVSGWLLIIIFLLLKLILPHFNPNGFFKLQTDKLDLCQSDINALLTEGRKSIATIVSVDYIKACPKFTEKNKAHIKENLQKDPHAMFAIHTPPAFSISYSFNPPDDEKEEDLIHTIITFSEPENHYKAGDPLPILYRIYRNEDDAECVDSMPFPLPFSDVYTPGCTTKNILFHGDITWLSEIEARNAAARRAKEEQERQKHFKKLDVQDLFVTSARKEFEDLQEARRKYGRSYW